MGDGVLDGLRTQKAKKVCSRDPPAAGTSAT